MATIAEHLGLSAPTERRRWRRIPTRCLQVGDLVRAGGVQRTVALIIPAVDDTYVVFSDGSRATVSWETSTVVMQGGLR